MDTTIILSSLGGIVAFLCAVTVIARGIFRQVTATEANTKALNELSNKFDLMDVRMNSHDTAIAILNDRIKRLSVIY